MRKVFADANYWVALLNPKDDLHGKATAVSAALGPCQIVTSEFVLLEMMNLLAKAGLHLKEIVYKAVQDMRNNPNIVVEPATSLLFQKASVEYLANKDKEWGCIDCSSMIIMRDKEISEALTYDKHFVQMGYRALLREEGSRE